MTAADGLRQPEQRAAATRGFRIALLVVLGIVVLDVAYCAGKSRGHADQKITALVAKRDTIRDTIRVVEQRLVNDAVRLRLAAAAEAKARAGYDSAKALVEAVADTALSVPTSLVMPAIQKCDQTIATDDTKYQAAVADLTDMTTDRDAQRARAENDEAQLALVKSARFGVRTGIAIGLSVAVGIAHFIH